MRSLPVVTGLCAGLLWSYAALGQTPLELVQATYFGTAGEDDIQGGGVGPDGTIYIVGNTGNSMAKLPGDVVPTRFGKDAGKPRCGHGFVAHLSADGSKILGYAEFGDGALMLTTVQVNEQGVYVAGYATEHLAPLLEKLPGLMREYPLARQVAKLEEAGKDAVANSDPTAEGRTRQLGRYGAPCVLRLSADLKTLQCGTYLEGWQQAWPKDRCISYKPKWKCWPREYTWQPTHVGLLKSKDVVVCHDGGYFRDLTEVDRKVAATIADPAASKKLLERLTFYDVCDHLSRLSPDLSKRAYRQDIYTPAVDLETIKRLKGGWPHPHYSNPRTLRMRLDNDDNIYIGGWSASATGGESWWSPYLWKISPVDGIVVWKAYEYDPMSGGGNRMGGTVADTAVSTLALDASGNVLAGLFSDGGNTIMGWSPRAVLGERFEGVVNGTGFGGGLVHFHSQLHRFEAKSRVGIGGARIGHCGWLVDVAALGDNGVLALGRCNFTFEWTPDAWQKGEVTENPEAWLRVYSPKLELAFSTAIRGVLPFAIVPLSAQRFLIVGQSRGMLDKAVQQADKSYEVAREPNPGLAITRNALYAKPAGGSDGYWMILDWKAAKGKQP